MYNLVVHAGTKQNGLFYKTSGNTWEQAPGAIPTTAEITGLPGLGASSPPPYAGTNKGLFYYIGTIWQQIPRQDIQSMASSFNGITQEIVYFKETLSAHQVQELYDSSKEAFTRDFNTVVSTSEALGNTTLTTIPVINQPNWNIVESHRAEYLLAPYTSSVNTPLLHCNRLNSNAIKALGPLLHEPAGIDALLSVPSQRTPEISFEILGPKTEYIPVSNFPSPRIDFTLNSAMSPYYWELFFHTPFLIANELNTHQHFGPAQTWYQYIFNPTVSQQHWDLETGDPHRNDKFWRFLGLRRYDKDNPTLNTELSERPTQELIRDINNPAERNEYETDPYDPQEIASLRPIAYQKTIVMHYVNNLINRGDMLFRENTRESIVEAEMFYVAAYDLLGEQPEDLGEYPLPMPRTYSWMGLHQLAACSLGTDRKDIFGLDSEGNLSLWEDPRSSSQLHRVNLGSHFPNGKKIQGSLAACSWGQSRADLFGLDSDGNVLHLYGDPGSSSQLDWENLGSLFTNGEKFQGSLAACSWDLRRLDLFGLDSDGNVLHGWWSGSGSWVGENLYTVQFPSSLPPALEGSVAACSLGSNRIDVFVLDSGGKVIHLFYNGAAWQSENLYTAQFPSNPPPALKGSLAACSWGGSNRIDVFGLDSGSNVLHLYCAISKQSSTSLEGLPGRLLVGGLQSDRRLRPRFWQ